METFERDSGEHTSSIRPKLSIHGPRSGGFMSLSRNGGGRKCSTTSKWYRQADKENSEKSKVKFPALRNKN